MVAPPSATQLAFSVQPSAANGGLPVSPPIQVEIRDASGNIVTGATNSVTLTLGTNVADGTLWGTTTVNAVRGTATFPDLSVDRPGTGYTMSATSAPLAGATSAGFDIRMAFAALSAGDIHNCGITTASLAYCWGNGSYGQLGDGSTSTTNRRKPVAVLGGLRFVTLSATGQRTCGITSSGVAFCWGDNTNGALGDGTVRNRTTPVAVAGGLRFTSITPACATTADGVAYCWGFNNNGAVGDGTTIDRMAPTKVIGGLRFVAITGVGGHNCGLTAAGAAYCWGANFLGQLGDGSSVLYRAEPVAVAGGISFGAISGGVSHTCALSQSGTAYCWGWNSRGTVGDGTRTLRRTPVAVSGGIRFSMISVGVYHACGVSVTGDAYCWGANSDGELGDGTIIDRASPVPVLGGLRFATVNSATQHTCGMTTSNAIYCWGNNTFGQLGDGTETSRSLPMPVVP